MSTPRDWYPVQCPSWCTGHHRPILALHDDPSAEALDAEETITHGRDLNDPAAGAGLVVSIEDLRNDSVRTEAQDS